MYEISASAGRVLDKDDLELPTHESNESTLNILDSLILPGLAHEVGDWGQASDDERVLVVLVAVEVSQFGIAGRLALKDSVESAMVLFQGHNAILQNASILSGSGTNLLKRGVKS